MNWRIEFSNNPYRDRERHHDCCRHHHRPRVSIDFYSSSPSPMSYDTMPMSYNTMPMSYDTMPMMSDSMSLGGEMLMYDDFISNKAIRDLYEDLFWTQQMEYEILMSTPQYDHRIGRWVLPNPYAGQSMNGASYSQGAGQSMDGASYSQGAGSSAQTSGYRNFGSHPLHKPIPGTKKHDAVDRERRRQLFDGENYFTAMAYNESYNKEKGTYNYSADNGKGYYGKYQFGKAALYDLGVMDRKQVGRNSKGNPTYQYWFTGREVQGKKINNLEDFFNNHAGQEQLMAEYTAKNWATIKKAGLDKLIGQTIHGINITKETLLAGAHLKGVGGLKQFLLKNQDNYDGNNVAISAYMYEFQGAKDPLGLS